MYLVLLFGFSLLGLSSLAQDFDPMSVVSSIAAASGTFTVAEYSKPTQVVTEFLAIGDSFTAGFGSNGKPDYMPQSGNGGRYTQAYPMAMLDVTNIQQWEDFNGGQVPKLNFGAYSGAKVVSPTQTQFSNQLQNPGQPWTDVPLHNVGSPQLAVMTLGGNDLGFGDAVNKCIYGVTFNDSCENVLASVEAKLNDVSQFRELLSTALYETVAAGRLGEGANPPESFQVYISGYVPFFYDAGPECDTVDLAITFGTPCPLLQTLRQRINGITLHVNSVIQEIANGLGGIGVIYVDGFQAAYDSHQFCNPEPAAYLNTQDSSDTWFWEGGDYDGGGEGPDPSAPPSASSSSLKQQLLDLFVPDPAVQLELDAATKLNPAAILEFIPEYNNTWSDLVNIVAEKTPNTTTLAWLPSYMQRVFHPKGTAYLYHAAAFLNAIQANRGSIVTTQASSSVSTFATTVPSTSTVKSSLPVPVDHPGGGPGNSPNRRGFYV